MIFFSFRLPRSLADLNADGQMDQKEFSIGVHLIKKKLQGIDLPKALPASLRAEPTSTRPVPGGQLGAGVPAGMPGGMAGVAGGSATGVMPGGMMSQPMTSTTSLNQHGIPGMCAIVRSDTFYNTKTIIIFYAAMLR